MIGELNNNAPQLQQNALNSLQQEQNNKILDQKTKDSQKADVQTTTDTSPNNSQNERAALQTAPNQNQNTSTNGPRGSVIDIVV